MNKTYEEAMNPERGWSHADEESMIAAKSQILGNKHAINPEAVYKWAIENEIDMDKLLELHSQIPLPRINNYIMADILNNEDKLTSKFIEENYED